MASQSVAFEDYSLYSNMSDDQLLQLAIERSLMDTDTHTHTTNDSHTHTTIDSHTHTTSNSNQPRTRTRTQNQTLAHYSSPNPPRETAPDPKTFEGTVSRFVSGSGKRMLAYRRHDGSLVHMCPEPEEEEEPLFRAIRLGDVGGVRTLVKSPGTNLMLPSKPGWLSVHQASFYGQDSCLRVLLSAQPGLINKTTSQGASPLMVAVSRQQLRCVQVLLESGADPNIINNDQETPLYRACESNNAALVAELLNHGAAVNVRCIHGCTALQEAAFQDNVEICDMLLRGGANHNVTNTFGLSPLFTAAQFGRINTLRFLLRHGADINTRAADGATALYEAARNGHDDAVQLLLSKKANANQAGRTGLLPLHIAAQRGSDTIVSMLIPATSRAAVRRSGVSPLHMAAERDRDEVLEVLMVAGFDVNDQLSEERSKLYEDRRSTVLYFSVINKNVHAVRALLAAGADPNLDMFRPLMVAARAGCIQTVALLVEHGADINAAIPTHPTTFPAVYMFSMTNLPMFKFLLDHGGHAHSCFHCSYGSRPHPPIRTGRVDHEDPRSVNHVPEARDRKGVQFCEMISVPSISRWAGPIIDVLLDYVGHVTLCSRLMEHLDSYSEWSIIKEKAAPPRPLMQLCRLHILRSVSHRRLKTLPLPGRLIGFLLHQQADLDD